MKRAIIAACLALMDGVWPAQAQLFPSPSGEPKQSAERVLIDAEIFVSAPDAPGLCFPLGSGQLTVTVRRLSDAIERRPTEFTLRGYQDDPDTNIAVPISGEDVTSTTRIKGSYHYCWSINVDAPETESMSGANRGAFVQTVAVRMVFTPQ